MQKKFILITSFLLLFSSFSIAKKNHVDSQQLIETLKAQCLKNYEKEKPALRQQWCECILRYHSKNTDLQGLKILVEVYSGTNKYETPNISEEINHLLNNDADIIEKCEKNPGWQK